MYTIRLESRPGKNSQTIIDTVNALDQEEFAGCEGLRLSECYIWIVRNEAGTPVGYGTIRYLPADKCGYFSRAAIKKEHRRKGLHKRLVQVRMAYAKKMGWKGILTYVSPTNVASANSLFKLGFQLYLPEYRWAGKEFLYLMKLIEE